ncbi:zinc finger protein 678-like [Myripristis murdjan]|uniref:Zinc finger protein 678-like n=1 Tax=Myripristis murdjan TaxID=586833 RepID=A0A667WN52_9TELE|nr:zinc finger protein 678-like [Myripristis murdjan]
MSSGPLAPPGGELCVFLLRDQEEEEEEERKKEVGCQWESPEERREVGCQSEAAERRDAAVQVDLLKQPGLLLQCFAVRPDGPDGGALLQHCNSSGAKSTSKRGTKRTSTVRRSSAKRSRTSCSNLQSETQQKHRAGKANAPRASTPTSSTERTSPHLHAVHQPQITLCKVSFPLHHSPDPSSPPAAEEEEDEARDPTWHPPADGDRVFPQPSAVLLDHSDAASPPSVPDHPLHRGKQPELLHQLHINPSQSSICDICGKVMKCKSSLARHSFIHTGEKPFACHLCDMRFNRQDNLQHHLNRLHPNGVVRVEKHRPDRAWLCDVCGKTFNCRSRLKTHELIHTGVKPHRCDLCPKAYMSTTDLEHHKKTVHIDGAGRPLNPSLLLCDLCGKEFKYRSQLSNHLQSHTGERPHLCDLCGRRFSRPYQLKRHKILIHGARAKGRETLQPDLPFVCTVCGKRVKSLALLTSHTRVHTGDKPHRCSICFRSFQRATRLKQHHMLVHFNLKTQEVPQKVHRRKDPTPPKVFTCQVCSKSFRFKSLLASHSLTHTGVKPHACEFCDRTFRRFSHLKRHREVVHANGAKLPESFVCSICGKDMKCKSNLERHAIIHTGEKPFACDLCTARFNRRGNLQEHKKRVHGIRVRKKEEEEDTLIVFNEAEDGPVSSLASSLLYKQEESLRSVDSEAGGCRTVVSSTT